MMFYLALFWVGSLLCVNHGQQKLTNFQNSLRFIFISLSAWKEFGQLSGSSSGFLWFYQLPSTWESVVCMKDSSAAQMTAGCPLKCGFVYRSSIIIQRLLTPWRLFLSPLCSSLPGIANLPRSIEVPRSQVALCACIFINNFRKMN